MIQTPIKTRTKFIPWLAGLLFKIGFKNLSWSLADWYMDRGSMKPVSPVIPGHSEVVYAKDQPQYNPLPSIKQPDGCVVTRWTMPWPERFQILFTGSVYLEVMTFNQPLQPLKMSTQPPEIESAHQFEPADIYEKAEAFR